MTGSVAPVASEAENKTADLMDDENALLQQALAMSEDGPVATVAMQDTDMLEASVDDQDLALALQLSVQEVAKDQPSQTDLPGVDPNGHSVKDLLASMQNPSEPEQKKDEDKDAENK